jgi:hypothetical protein
MLSILLPTLVLLLFFKRFFFIGWDEMSSGFQTARSKLP